MSPGKAVWLIMKRSNGEISHPTRFQSGGRPKRRLEDRWSTGEPESSPRPVAHRQAKRRRADALSHPLDQTPFGLPPPVASVSATLGG